MLETLARRVPLAVVTNCSETLGRVAVARIGVAFDVVVTAERAGHYKPHPRPYRLALEGARRDGGGRPLRRRLPYDLFGAAAIGMPVFWHNRLRMTAPPSAPAPLAQHDNLYPLLQSVMRQPLPLIAAVRSAIRSPGSSIPTESRSRSGAPGCPAPSTEARCSIRLSTPPSEVARFQTSTRAAAAIAAAAPPRTRMLSMPPKPPIICRVATACPGWPGRPGYSTSETPGCAASASAICCAGAAGPLDPRIKGAHAAQQEIGLEAAEDGAPAAARRDEARPECVLARRRQRAGDHVAVPVQVFGRRMHDEIGAEAQRPGQHRRRRGAVDGEQRAAAMGDLGGAGDVGHRPQRVGRRLDPDERVRPGRTARRSASSDSRIDELDRETPGLGKVPQASCAAPNT